MTLTSGDSILVLPSVSGKPIAIKVTSPQAGDKVVTIPTRTGPVAVRVSPIAPGDKVILVRDVSGKQIALKATTIPHPPPVVGWTGLGGGGGGAYSWALVPWGSYIYHCQGNTLGILTRYSYALGYWETVFWGVVSVYDAVVFGGKLYVSYQGWFANGGIVRSSDGSIGSFAQVYDTGSDTIWVEALAVHGGKIYGILQDYINSTWKIISSADGTTWSIICTFPQFHSLHGLTSDGSQLYTGWFDFTLAPPYPADVLSSANGIGWGACGYGLAAGERVYGVDYAGGHVYAGSDTEIFRDGSSVCVTGGVNWAFCECGDLIFAAGGSPCAVYCSEDGGVTWTSNYAPGAPWVWMMAVGALGKHVIAGTGDPGNTTFLSPEIK